MNNSLKILYIANFASAGHAEAIYNTDYKIQQGLIELGHFVYAYDYKFMIRKSNIFNTTALGHSKVHQQLISICENLKPDLIILGHVHIPSNILTTMKNINKSKVIAWFVDTINEFNRIEHFKNLNQVIDYIFATTGGHALKKFSKLLPNTVFAFTPNFSLSSLEHHRENWEQYDYDLIFCGSDKKRPGRASFIEDIISYCPTTNFKIAGCLGHPALQGSNYLDTVRNTLMGINYSKYNDIDLYSSDRIAQLTGNGCMVLTPYIPYFEILFDHNSVSYFKNENDLHQKINFFTKNPDQAIEIAKNGYNLAHTVFESRNILAEWIKLIYKQTTDCSWKNEVYVNGNKI